jgi:hypothetical protein
VNYTKQGFLHIRHDLRQSSIESCHEKGCGTFIWKTFLGGGGMWLMGDMWERPGGHNTKYSTLALDFMADKAEKTLCACLHFGKPYVISIERKQI